MATPEERLRALGMSDTDIQTVLEAVGSEDDGDDPISNPKSLRDWKQRSRRYEQETQSLQAELASYKQRDMFEQVRAQLPDEERGLIGFEDVRGEPKITPALLRVKIQEKRDAEQAEAAKVAKAYGFENPEEFKTVLDFTRQQIAAAADRQNQNVRSIASQTSVTMGAGVPAPGSTAKLEAEAAAEEGDVDRVLEVMKKNRGAFARTIGETGRPA